MTSSCTPATRSTRPDPSLALRRDDAPGTDQVLRPWSHCAGSISSAQSSRADATQSFESMGQSEQPGKSRLGQTWTHRLGGPRNRDPESSNRIRGCRPGCTPDFSIAPPHGRHDRSGRRCARLSRIGARTARSALPSRRRHDHPFGVAEPWPELDITDVTNVDRRTGNQHDITDATDVDRRTGNHHGGGRSEFDDIADSRVGARRDATARHRPRLRYQSLCRFHSRFWHRR